MGLWAIPTKAMLAGEYGVLAPKGRALALAVTPSLRVASAPTPGVNVVRLEAAPGTGTWEFLPETVAAGAPLDALPPQNRLPAAIWATAQEAGLPTGPMVIDLSWTDSEGWSPVGTSAGIAVGLSLALADGDRSVATRLAWAGHARAQGGGSGYDVATSIYGGAVKFLGADGPLAQSVGEMGWPRAEAVKLAPGLRIVEASTGRRAATRELLAGLETARRRDPGVDLALAAHREASESLIQALTGETLEPVPAAVDGAAATLEDLDGLLGGAILTDEARTLVDIARRAGVPARVSGAGGGDNVVAFARTEWLASRLRMRWIQAGFAARILEPAPGPFGVS